MKRTVPPSAEIEEQIDELLAVGVGENPRESLSGLAKLGARLIIQRAVEDEFDAWLGRARYERRPEYQRGLRNGFRPRRMQTGEGELEVGIPQVREAAEPFVSKLFPRGTKLLRTEPLKALVIGAFVLARPGARSDRPRARRPDADRRRRRAGADQGRRAVLAGLRPPTLLCSPSSQPARKAARARARTRPSGLLAGPR